MAIYEITTEHLAELTPATFSELGIKERSDLQRVLRNQIEVIAPGILIIAEEFGEWEDSKRRIDLLGIDKDANLVVIELKRTEDGGHMDLQAIRYAAMVSTMDFDQAVEALGRFMEENGNDQSPHETMLKFLDWEEPGQEVFAQHVRIVLASAEFSKELTTTVMWLNEQNLDIRCIRLQPYSDGDRVLLDVQQIIPLPEVEQYQIQVREKDQRERKTKQEKTERHTLRHLFWTELLEQAKATTTLHENISPGESSWVGAGAGIGGLSFNYTLIKHGSAVELYIDKGKDSESVNKIIFDALKEDQEEIENVFGETLEWERLEGKRGCRIVKRLKVGGYRDGQEKWPEIYRIMIENMIRLENALRPYIDKLK